MANTSRTVTLNLNANTSGAEGVQALANELGKLAKSGGQAAPEFEKLSQELTQIAQQQATVDQFQELDNAIKDSRAAMDGATKATNEQNEALRLLRDRLAPLRTAEEQSALAVKDATRARQQANLELLQAQKAVSEYATSLGGAKKANAEQKVELAALNQAVRQAKDAYLGSKEALKSLTIQHTAAKDAMAPVSVELQKQQRALSDAAATSDKAKSEYDALSVALTEVSGRMTRLGIDTQNITGEQNRLAQSMGRLKTEADKLKSSISAPGEAAVTAAQKIDQAFAQTGVRSANNLKAEILKINTALMTLARDATISGADFDRAFASGKARIAELEAQLKKADVAAKSAGDGIGNAFRQFGPATLVFNGISAGINAMVSAAQKVPQVAAEFQTLARTLKILTGDSNSAAREMEYIKTVANRVGGDIKDLADGYIKLTAATKGTNLEGGQTRRIFEAVAGSMGVLGSSSAETARAIQAVTQIVSKGVVSMEEFRQQLAERLPGAFQVTAKQLGITTAELNDLISSGRLTADDVLPALARGLEEMYKSGSQNDTLIGQWHQFTNALKEAADQVGKSGMLEKLLEWGRVGAAVAVSLVGSVGLVGKAIGILAAGIATGDIKGALAAIKEEAIAFDASMGKIAGRAEATKKPLSELAAEAKAAGQAFVTMADGTKIAVADIEKADGGFIKFLVTTTRAKESAEGFATSARKAAEYTRSAGESSLAAANALGNEIDKRNIAVRVADENATALSKVTEAEQRLLVEMQKEALFRAEAIRDGRATSDAHKQQLIDLGKEIEQRQVVVGGLNRQVEANRLLSETLRVKAEMEKDNSGRLVELNTRNEEFVRVLAIVRAEVEAGRLSQAQLNVIEQEAMKTKALYVDALNDQQEKIKALNAQRNLQLDSTRAGINLEIEQLRTQAEVAKAYGDEASAANYLLQIKRLEIELAGLTAKAKKADAEASILLAKSMRTEALASGNLTAAKEAELRAMEIGAEVKLKEGQIAEETAYRMEQLMYATQGGADAAGKAAGEYRDLADSLNEVGDSADRAGKGVRNVSGTQLGGLSRIGGQGDFTETFYRRGASVEEKALAEKYVGELYARQAATTLTGNLGNESNAARLQKQAVNTAVDQALAAARKELATGKAVDLGTPVGDLIERDLNKRPLTSFEDMSSRIKNAGNEAARATTVIITIGGKKQAVQVASNADANALAGILGELEKDSLRTF